MPTSAVCCRHCDRPMKLWPANLPPNNPMFNCKEQHCFNRGLEIRNTGANR